MTLKGAYRNRQISMVFPSSGTLDKFKTWAVGRNMTLSKFIIDTIEIHQAEVEEEIGAKAKARLTALMKDLAEIREDNEKLREENHVLRMALSQAEFDLKKSKDHSNKISSKIIDLFVEEFNTPLTEKAIVNELKNFSKKEIFEELTTLLELGIVEETPSGRYCLRTPTDREYVEYTNRDGQRIRKYVSKE